MILLLMMKLQWTLGIMFLDFYSTVESSCTSDYCYHGGTCTGTLVAKCTCTVGFVGKRCNENGMKSFRDEINSRVGFNNTHAKQDTEKVKQIIQEHIDYNYQLPETVKYMNEILEHIASVMRKESKQNKAMENADFLPLTEDYVDILAYAVTVLNNKGCNVGQTVNCTVNVTEYLSLLDKAEDNVIRITSVMVLTKVEEGQMTTINKKDIISFTVLKSKGKDLPFNFQSAYGSITLPYWETCQDTIGEETVALNVLTYKESPYGFVNNTDAVSSGIIKVAITDKNGARISLKDPDDLVDMTVEMSQVFSATHTWKEMERLSDGRSLCVAYKNSTYASFVLELNIKSQTTCEVYGIYGNTGYPTKTKRDLAVRTKGINKILYSSPFGLPLNFANQVLQITIHNPEYTKGGYMDPLVLTIKCADDVAKRKRRQASSNIHQYRIQELSLSQLDGVLWKDPTEAKIDKAEGSHIKFKSTFFGTFASNTLFIPPTEINFEAIFLNFFERLRQTPHVLITYIILITVVINLTLYLRRLDKRDHFIWEYLPLADNKQHYSFKYTISAFTAIRSSNVLTSTPYFVLEGSRGSTGDRILFDGQRENFRGGTCSNFIMTTKVNLGKLKKLTIWTDNKGSSPDWKLSKIVVVDLSTREGFTFLCGEWISQKYGNCDMWVDLRPLSKDVFLRQTVFRETTRKGFFDDHLWFSISKRPQYSQFTRVQRLWTLMALLFLSMVASAMWFNQEPSEDDKDPDAVSEIRTVELGPFKLSYKQLYVGFMSSLITFLPSILIVSIFKNRRLKKKKGSSISKNEEKSNHLTERENRKLLPWWSVFFAYALIVLCITTAGTFTFLYSLEFGTDKTNDWLLSFVFGTFLGVLIVEPVKVLFIAVLIACCLQRSIETLVVLEESFEDIEQDFEAGRGMEETEAFYYPCPSIKANSKRSLIKKKRFKLDNDLVNYFKSSLLCILYILLLAMICSHVIITKAFHQNEAMKISINNSFLANTTDDIWKWLLNYYTPAVWRKKFFNGDLRTAYEQRFTSDGYNYRMSLIQLRQVRSYGNCNGPNVVQYVVKKCTNSYDIDADPITYFCPGWANFNSSCFDENELTDYSFHYKSSSELKSLPFFGTYAYYSGGGYRMQLGPKQSLVMKHINELKSKSWIDGYTRAIFIDSNTFNANSRLFTHLKVVFEISEYGAITMTTISKSSNLYPYVYALDYIILCLQIVFGIIIVVKMILFGTNAFKLKWKCFVTFGMWVTLVEIILALSAIVFFIIRVDKTIKAVEDINNNNGAFVSFEEVEICDEMYRIFIGGVFLIVILRLLQPLAFNYHLFVLTKSLDKAKVDLVSYIIMLSLCLVAFASFLHLTVGRTTSDFRSMITSLRTLLQMLLSMISFRFSVEMSSMQAQVIISLFAFTVSIIGINIFIGIITWTFFFVKLLQTHPKTSQELRFNQELNDHFWWRINQLLQGWFFNGCAQIEIKDINNKRIVQTIESIDQRLNNILKEEIEWTFYTLAMMLICKKEKCMGDSIKNPLLCHIAAQNNNIQYRFFDQSSKLTKIVLHLPYVKTGDAPEIVCRQVPLLNFTAIGISIPYSQRAKTVMFEMITKLQGIKKRCRITFKCGSIRAEDIVQYSYNNMRTWKSKLLYQIESLGVFSCNFSKLPTHCFVVHRQETIKLDIGELYTFPDLERHQLLKFGQCIRLRTDDRINITILPNAIQEKGDVIILVEKHFAAICPMLQLYSTRKINGNIGISLPFNYMPEKTSQNGVTRELWVLIREKNADWRKIQCQVVMDFGQIVLNINGIKMKTPTALCVKEVVLPWGQLVPSTQDWKFRQEINLLSHDTWFKRHWRDLAEKCSVTLSSKFDEGHIPYFISVENRNYAFNMNRCSFRRITMLPFSDEEKCLTVLSTWLKGMKSRSVTSLISLLKEYNLPYLPDVRI